MVCAVDGGPLRDDGLRLGWSMPDQMQKPTGPQPWGPWGPKESGEGGPGGSPGDGAGGGPRSPEVSKPATEDLLKRMRRVDPNQSRRYRQRTGQ